MPSMLHSIKEMARVAYAQNPYVTLIDETTNDDPWGPTGAQMDEVCRTYKMGGEASTEIMAEIVTRLEKRKEGWRRCYKCLLLLDHMARTLPERYVHDLDRIMPMLSTISRSFYHTDSKGVDQGSNIRERAKKLLALLQDREYLAEERKKSAATAAKVGGIGSGGGASADRHGGGGGGSDRSNVISSRQSMYGSAHGNTQGYDDYVPRAHRTNSGGITTTTASVSYPVNNTGRALTAQEQEDADMAFAARLQAEEEKRSGTRVADTDIGRRMTNEGQREKQHREHVEWERQQALRMQQQQRLSNTTTTSQQPPSTGDAAMDAEAKMAMELQARLDRGEDIESAIAAITAAQQKTEPQQQQQQRPPQQQQQQAPPPQVVDPFAAPPQQQQQQQQQAKPNADLDFFADIPQGNLVNARNGAPAQPKTTGGMDDFFGSSAPQQPQQQQFQPQQQNFFGQPAPQQQQQPQQSALDFFGNPTPAAPPAQQQRPAGNAFNDDFFATPVSQQQQQNTLQHQNNGSDPFAQAQLNSLDALANGGRKAQVGLGQAGNSYTHAPVW